MKVWLGIPVLLVLVLSIGGCGGSGGNTAAATADSGPVASAYAAKADTICGQAVRETARLGAEFRSHVIAAGESPLSATTRELIAPGLKIRQKTAERLRALGPPPGDNAAATLYVEFFDPLEVLVRQRLQAGLEGNATTALHTEDLLQRMGTEQIAAARDAGMTRCATNLIKVAFEPSGG
jgi:hypothetical protein